MNFIVCDSTGVILRTGRCPDDMGAHQARPGELVFSGIANDDTEYVDVLSGTVKPKTPILATVDKNVVAADDVDMVTITSLPLSATIEVYGPNGRSVYGVDDGLAQITFDTPGKYEVWLHALHRIRERIVIDAN